jgi:hypothetical protein
MCELNAHAHAHAHAMHATGSVTQERRLLRHETRPLVSYSAVDEVLQAAALTSATKDLVTLRLKAGRSIDCHHDLFSLCLF